MFKIVNLGNQEMAIKTIAEIKENDYVPFDVEIRNSHITELNKILGRKIFKNCKLYIGSQTLWEIMQPIGKKGVHHHHGLSPYEVYSALASLRFSKDISISYDNRYLIVTLATTLDNVNIAVIVTPKGNIEGNQKKNVNRVITLYPYKKKWVSIQALASKTRYSTTPIGFTE